MQPTYLEYAYRAVLLLKHALAAGPIRLASTASPEIDANDPNDPDGTPNVAPSNADRNDGPLRMVLQIVSIPPPAFMDLSLSVPNGGQSGQYFLNILIDLAMETARAPSPLLMMARTISRSSSERKGSN